MEPFIPPSFGWHQSVPDFRDYSPRDGGVEELWDRSPAARPIRKRPPARVDLREFFPPVTDQLHLNASPSHACLAMFEYFDRRAHGRMVSRSRLFHYKSARQLLQVSGDTGVDLRTALKAIVRFGLPPDQLYPYDPQRFDEEPPPFLFSFGDGCASLCYLRLDMRNGEGRRTALETVKAFLAAGFPSVFGFCVPDSISRAADIPYRPTYDGQVGGHAVVGVGYDDRHLSATTGALLIRNSWGSTWGDDGYGWLPYAFAEEQLAVDFWTLLRPDWLATGEFRRPAVGEDRAPT